MALKINPQRCPTCNERLEACTVVQEAAGRKIRPGDFSICAYCGQILVFDETLTQRAVTENDFRDVDLETMQVIVKARSAVDTASRVEELSFL